MPEENTANSQQDQETYLKGIVIRSTGSWYDVQTENHTIPSKVRGKFRLSDTDATNPVIVGDRVKIRINQDGTGLITKIYERRNKLTRRAAGRRVGQEQIIAVNVDAAWIVQSIRMPKINAGLIDRFLVMAESFEISPGIVFNKLDLMQRKDTDAIAFLRDLYSELGYLVLLTSTLTREGIDAFAEALAGKTNVIAGPSGVGKSALLNAIEPNLELRTSSVSEKTRKGKHTTTTTNLYPLSAGGYVADTPGIREFGVIDLAPEELSYYFVEFRPYLPECFYPNCTHDHEPGCAVKPAVERDEIKEERYDSYLNILESIRMGTRDVGR